MIKQALAKEWNMLHHEKQALKPLTIEESRRIRQTMADRILPARLVLTSRIDDEGLVGLVVSEEIYVREAVERVVLI